MTFPRGLAALILTLITSLSLHANFLYKDDVVHNDLFAKQIEAYGDELYAKTGIALYLVMLHDLEENQTIADLKNILADELQEPFVVLAFVEERKDVEIFAQPSSLYKDFNRKQVLSPNATFADALISAVMFARSWENYNEIMDNYGGTILPILGQKTKGVDTVKKYSVAMYNGYADIADQIAETRNVELSTSAGNEGKIFLDLLRLVFYGIILYALIIFIRNKMRKRKQTDEQ
ncbi:MULTISPECIES: 3-dehydroquinate dehydratase [Sulfurimonas]|uniref:3-dehydroquinate dehydratase n=1 Tax=Sulfurimonas diazotrophicus TaxID=3131939 RepID=A0ABZ3HB37_9BACT